MKGSKRKKKMGRPPLPPEKVRASLITMRVTAEDRDRLEHEAREAGLSISAYLLRCWRRKGV